MSRVMLINVTAYSATWVTRRTGRVEILPVRFKVEMLPSTQANDMRYQYRCQVKTGPDLWATVVIHIDLATARDWLLRKGPDANFIDIYPR